MIGRWFVGFVVFVGYLCLGAFVFYRIERKEEEKRHYLEVLERLELKGKAAKRRVFSRDAADLVSPTRPFRNFELTSEKKNSDKLLPSGKTRLIYRVGLSPDRKYSTRRSHGPEGYDGISRGG